MAQRNYIMNRRARQVDQDLSTKTNNRNVSAANKTGFITAKTHPATVPVSDTDAARTVTRPGCVSDTVTKLEDEARDELREDEDDERGV